MTASRGRRAPRRPRQRTSSPAPAPPRGTTHPPTRWHILPPALPRAPRRARRAARRAAACRLPPRCPCSCAQMRARRRRPACAAGPTRASRWPCAHNASPRVHRRRRRGHAASSSAANVCFSGRCYPAQCGPCRAPAPTRVAPHIPAAARAPPSRPSPQSSRQSASRTRRGGSCGRAPPRCSPPSRAARSVQARLGPHQAPYVLQMRPASPWRAPLARPGSLPRAGHPAPSAGAAAPAHPRGPPRPLRAPPGPRAPARAAAATARPSARS
mmetsp:Transcript_19480/g.60532  ORF Transcript_19480/g.60532 Transcript_19480/m.60532 type:complete len:270 (-) Transcript_19480:131-940(-)